MLLSLTSFDRVKSRLAKCQRKSLHTWHLLAIAELHGGGGGVGSVPESKGESGSQNAIHPHRPLPKNSRKTQCHGKCTKMAHYGNVISLIFLDFPRSFLDFPRRFFNFPRFSLTFLDFPRSSSISPCSLDLLIFLDLLRCSSHFPRSSWVIPRYLLIIPRSSLGNQKLIPILSAAASAKDVFEESTLFRGVLSDLKHLIDNKDLVKACEANRDKELRRRNTQNPPKRN